MTSPTETPIPTAVWRLTYAGRDVSADLAPMVTKVVYTDQLHGKSDELQIWIEDHDGRWRGPWFPNKADKLTLSFGWKDGPMQNAGGFEVDDVDYEDPPALMVIKAVSAGITPDLRTEKTRGHNGMSLTELVGKYALEHKLDVVGSVPAVSFERLTQRQETDLAFLQRIAEENGCVVTIRDHKLVFTDRAQLNAAPPARTIVRGDRTVKQVRLRRKAAQTFGAAVATYRDPTTDKDIEVRVDAPNLKSADVHRLTERVENEAQARARASAALNDLNAGETGGTITLVGDPSMAAGARLAISGWGRFDGVYLIQQARHEMVVDGGFTTELELKAG